jgi:hypothetical protein
MFLFLEQSRETFAGALGKPCATAIPTSNETCHGFGGPFESYACAARTQQFQRLPHLI